MKYKRFIKILVALTCLSIVFSACSTNTVETTETSEITAITVATESTSETTTIDPTDELVSEHEAEEVTDEELPYEVYEESIIMYGARELTYYDGFGLSARAAGKITIGESYEVVGETPTSYATSIDDEVYRIAKLALSIEEVEVVEEPSETDETDGNETEPTETLPNGNTPTPRPTRTPSGGGSNPPGLESHTMQEWMQIQGISQYTTTDGHTVYGRYIDTSGLDQAVQSYRAGLGLPAYEIGDNSLCRQRAIDGYSTSAPYYHVGVSNCTTANASGAYNAFYNSQGHRGAWEDGLGGTYGVNGIGATYTIYMSSASFDFYEYCSEIAGFVRVSSMTVQNFVYVWD